MPTTPRMIHQIHWNHVFKVQTVVSVFRNCPPRYFWWHTKKKQTQRLNNYIVVTASNQYRKKHSPRPLLTGANGCLGLFHRDSPPFYLFLCFVLPPVNMYEEQTEGHHLIKWTEYSSSDLARESCAWTNQWTPCPSPKRGSHLTSAFADRAAPVQCMQSLIDAAWPARRRLRDRRRRRHGPSGFYLRWLMVGVRW